MKTKNVYKIIFVQLGEIYEVFAKQIYQSDMYGFIEVEEYIFNKDKQLVVDPSSEKLKNEFLKVKRSYIPVNSVIRIDEVNESGEAKIKENKGKVSPIPLNLQPSNNKD
tara:strand:- start:1371 stop:1697 length:327 start_codon:yes stop_codon:yes gene_type:complete